MAKIVILSGAGVSAESGISTFRDNDGLWENHSIKEVCTEGCLHKNRKKVIDFYNMLRLNLENKKANYAHNVISSLKNEFKEDIAVITQNVDDMFEKANCKDIIHLHGFLKEIYCEHCNYVENIEYKEQELESKCPKCNHYLRPNIVFFGEEAPAYSWLHRELSSCKMLVVIGTSGFVINTDEILRRYLNIEISIINILEPSKYLDDSLYTKVLYKKATKAIDEIANDIKAFLNKT